MYCFYSTGDSTHEARNHVYYVPTSTLATSTNTEHGNVTVVINGQQRQEADRRYPLIPSKPAHVCVMHTSSRAHVHRTVRRKAPPQRTYAVHVTPRRAKHTHNHNCLLPTVSRTQRSYTVDSWQGRVHKHTRTFVHLHCAHHPAHARERTNTLRITLGFLTEFPPYTHQRNHVPHAVVHRRLRA